MERIAIMSSLRFFHFDKINEKETQITRSITQLLVRHTYSKLFATHFTLILTTSNSKAIAGQGPVISSLRLQNILGGSA